LNHICFLSLSIRCDRSPASGNLERIGPNFL
jgi:hypothetical protein